MSKDITPGLRLKELIEKRGLSINEAANLIKVDRATMSRYVNDRQKISAKSLKALSKIFNVTEEYLRCDTYDPGNPEWGIKSTSDEGIDESKQNYQFGEIKNWLNSLGAEIITYIYLSDDENPSKYCKYRSDDRGAVYPVYDDNEEPSDIYELYLDDILDQISLNPEKAKVTVKIIFKNKESDEMDYSDYLKWLKRLNIMGEVSLHEKVGLSQNIDFQFAENDITRALAGKREKKVESMRETTNSGLDKSMDLFLYTDELGVLRFVIDKDYNVEFAIDGICTKKELKEIVDLLKKDNKGFYFDNNGKIKYDPEKHIVGALVSSEEERETVRNIVIKNDTLLHPDGV